MLFMVTILLGLPINALCYVRCRSFITNLNSWNRYADVWIVVSEPSLTQSHKGCKNSGYTKSDTRAIFSLKWWFLQSDLISAE